MKMIGISNFKNKALKIVDEVSKSHESIVITKRGKAVAELIPFRSSQEKATPGKLSSTLVEEKDIVSPFGHEIWEVCK